MNSHIKFIAMEDNQRDRLDKFLANVIPNISRSKLKQMILSNSVMINSNLVKDVNYRIQFMDEITIFLEDQQESIDIIPEKGINFSILYEDEDIIVLNKPAGLVVHPGAGNWSGTLVNGLMEHSSGCLSSGGEKFRPGIVHRIDKDTSGILVIAKNDFSHNNLAKQFHDHSIKRKYMCYCFGVPAAKMGRIQTLIKRDVNNRLKMSVSSSGKEAITVYNVIENFSNLAAKIQCELYTGRTHQIRVHMSHIGHSLIGDRLYKKKNYPISNLDFVKIFKRQALHAYFLEFQHPTSKRIMTFQEDLPKDLCDLEKNLKNNLNTKR